MNAIILVDIQNELLPTGSLPVPQGDGIIDDGGSGGRADVGPQDGT